ncbi:SDR family NAD(P)-dependent oxidoreductase [Microbacterium sp. No. 7]|uniref:SDR family NAD(P)-dependent oxidoreductase n=1 Tax=Microbacterium sp. No. 7 TaxID=1714373 RepID=UPI0006CFC63C|nr:SDR family NAD(P)-dependent oxidoreductase [Microbacterium sp. No. 7]ALJ18901.1 hypothetical protein AOA12_02840 [Microbacterium sp. No. 7]
MDHLTDRTWLVTGASSGLGEAIARAAHAAGARVAGTARELGRLDGLPRDERMLRVALDLADPASVDAAVARVEAELGPVDVVVNNAGYGLLGAVEETSEAEARAQFDANFFGPALLTSRLLAGLRARRRGAIVNVSSVSGVRGAVGSAYYAASKHALEGWSNVLRVELADHGIPVLVVEPGAFRTQFFGRSRVLTADRLPGVYPGVDARRAAEVDATDAQPGDPERGAAAILRALASDPPPRRLVLGTGAVRLVRETFEERLAEVGEWRAVSESADG